jgi:hypothetical protein
LIIGVAMVNGWESGTLVMKKANDILVQHGRVKARTG